MTDTNMTQFKTEGKPAFPVENTETANSADSSSVNDSKETTTDQTGSSDQNQTQTQDKKDDGDAGFAEHPRWKERETDWQNRFNAQEQRHTEELTKFREGMNTAISTAVAEALQKAGVSGKSNAVTEEVPEWFGGDEKAWERYSEHTNQLVEKAVEQALKQFSTKSESEQKAIDQATSFFNDQVKLIETDKALNPQGEKVDRNKLLKFVLDNDLVDSQGRWNYKAGWQLMRANATAPKTDSTKDRKDLASATTADTRAESKPSSFSTSKDFQNPANRPW